MLHLKKVIFLIFIFVFICINNIYAASNFEKIDPEKKAKAEISGLEEQKKNAKENSEIAHINLMLAERYLLYPDRDVDKAMELLQEIIKIAPQSLYADDATFLLGYIYRKEKKDYENALKYFQQLLQNYPGGVDNTEYFYEDLYSTRNKTTWNDDAQYQIGLIYKFFLKNPNLAMQNFQKLVETYPDSPFANDALYEMALINEEKQDYKQAYLLYQKICDEYPFGIADFYYQGNIDASLLARQKIEALHKEHNTPNFNPGDAPKIVPGTDLVCKLASTVPFPEGENAHILFDITNKSSYPIILGSAYSTEDNSSSSFWSRWSSTDFSISWLNTRTGDLRYNEGKKRMEEFPILNHITPTWYPYTSGLLLPGQTKRFSLLHYIEKDAPVKIKLSFMPITFQRLAKCSVSLAINEKIPAFTAGMTITNDAVAYGHPLPDELEQGRHETLIISTGALPDFSEYEFSYKVEIIPLKFSKNAAIEAIGGIQPASSLYSKKFNAWIFSIDKDLWLVKKDSHEKLTNCSIHVFEYLESSSHKSAIYIKGSAANAAKYPLIEKLKSTYSSEKKENVLIIMIKDEDILSVLKELNQNGLHITVDSWYLNPVILVTE